MAAGGAGAVRAGAAYIEIFANDSKFMQSLRKMENRLKATAATMRTIGTGFMSVGAAIAAPILAAANSFATFGSEIYDMSQRTGIAAESLSVLRFAAQQTGADMAGMETAVKFMQKAIDAAGNGSKKAAAALARIGLTAAQLQGLKPEEQMGAIADGLAQISDPAERTAIAVALFGRAGTAILPMLAGGSAGLNAFAAEAARLGLVMDKDTAAKADALGDAIDKLKQAAFMAFIQIGSAVAPMLTSMAESLAKVAARVGEFIRNNGQLVRTLLQAAVWIAATGAAFLAASFAFSVAAKAVGMLRAALSLIPALLSPIGLTLAGIGIAVGGLVVIARTLSPAFRRETDAIMAAIMQLDFGTAWEIMNLNLAIALTKMGKAVSGFVGFIQNAFTAAGLFVGDKLVEGLDRFMGLFGADILTLQAGLEKLGLLWRAAFDWQFAVTGLNAAMKEVDDRIAREREANPTASGRAAARTANRRAAADQRQREADESEQRWNDTLEALNDDLQRAHDRLKPKPQAEAEAQKPFTPGIAFGDLAEAMGGAGKDKGFSTLGTFGTGEGLGIGPELAAMADPAQQTAENTAAIADILEGMDTEDLGVDPTAGASGAAAGSAAAATVPQRAAGAQAGAQAAAQSVSLSASMKASLDAVAKAIADHMKLTEAGNQSLAKIADNTAKGLAFS